MTIKKSSIALVLGATFVFLTFGGIFAGETQKKLTSESVIETIMKRGKLKVGMSTFVPWAMRNKKGELIGFEIDVAKKVAADMKEWDCSKPFSSSGRVRSPPSALD